MEPETARERKFRIQQTAEGAHPLEAAANRIFDTLRFWSRLPLVEVFGRLFHYFFSDFNRSNTPATSAVTPVLMVGSGSG